MILSLAACHRQVRPMAAGGGAALPVPVDTASSGAADPADPVLPPEKEELFAMQAALLSASTPAEIDAWLSKARYQKKIIEAISRPAEAKPWKDYRPIFLDGARIANGRAFLAEHRAELDAVQAQTGVPAEIIVAIIGVETNYGRITGNYRVLDALYTLGFFYPKREEFFRGELLQLFALAKEEKLDLGTLKGSYAGAMGWGQFMPSSYRNFARDGDGDGRRDLFNSTRDVFASIANYFIGHGWQAGQPVFVPAAADAGAAPFVPENFEASYSLADLATRGYRPQQAGAEDLPVTLLTLEGANGPEYWIGYRNFSVITRYNRSPLYAMAVFQLASEIGAGDRAAASP